MSEHGEGIARPGHRCGRLLERRNRFLVLAFAGEELSVHLVRFRALWIRLHQLRRVLERAVDIATKKFRSDDGGLRDGEAGIRVQSVLVSNLGLIVVAAGFEEFRHDHLNLGILGSKERSLLGLGDGVVPGGICSVEVLLGGDRVAERRKRGAGVLVLLGRFERHLLPLGRLVGGHQGVGEPDPRGRVLGVKLHCLAISKGRLGRLPGDGESVALPGVGDGAGRTGGHRGVGGGVRGRGVTDAGMCGSECSERVRILLCRDSLRREIQRGLARAGLQGHVGGSRECLGLKRRSRGR